MGIQYGTVGVLSGSIAPVVRVPVQYESQILGPKCGSNPEGVRLTRTVQVRSQTKFGTSTLERVYFRGAMRYEPKSWYEYSYSYGLDYTMCTSGQVQAEATARIMEAPHDAITGTRTRTRSDMEIAQLED